MGWVGYRPQAEPPDGRVSIGTLRELYKMVELPQLAHVCVGSYQGKVTLQKRSKYFESCWLPAGSHLKTGSPGLGDTWLGSHHTEVFFFKSHCGCSSKRLQAQGWAKGLRPRGHPSALSPASSRASSPFRPRWQAPASRSDTHHRHLSLVLTQCRVSGLSLG